MARNSLAHVARGSDGAMFFQWRQSRRGAEKFHSAMPPHGGTETRVWRGLVELGAALDSLSQISGTGTRADVPSCGRARPGRPARTRRAGGRHPHQRRLRVRRHRHRHAGRLVDVLGSRPERRLVHRVRWPQRQLPSVPLLGLRLQGAVPDNKGLGVFSWEATRTAVTGNGWDPTDSSSGNGGENQALFDYGNKATSATSWFSHR